MGTNMKSCDCLLENMMSINDRTPFPHTIIYFKDAVTNQAVFNAACRIKKALKIGRSNCLIQQGNAFIRVPPSKVKRLSEFTEIVKKEAYFGVPYTYIEGENNAE